MAHVNIITATYPYFREIERMHCLSVWGYEIRVYLCPSVVKMLNLKTFPYASTFFRSFKMTNITKTDIKIIIK
jgi:hypothetical protein